MEKYISNHNSDIIHTRLADIYFMAHNYTYSMKHYNIALNINPNYEKADTGLARVEAFINKKLNSRSPQKEEDQDMM
jgi:hypothetical protein